MGRRGVEQLADAAEPRVREVIGERIEEGLGTGGVARDPMHRQGIVGQQPGPGRTLVVGAIARGHVAVIVRLVGGIGGAEGEKAVGGRQRRTDRSHYVGLIRGIERLLGDHGSHLGLEGIGFLNVGVPGLGTGKNLETGSKSSIHISHGY